MSVSSKKLLLGTVPQVSSQGLEEAVVTAQKREQSLQDVAASVSAVNDDSLVKNQINYMDDLQRVIPSLSIGDSQGQAPIFIRGIGLDQVFTGADPSVAVHIDDAEKRSLRGKLAFDLGESAELLLSADYHREDDAAYGFHYLDVQRDDLGPAPPLAGAVFARDIRDVASDVDYQNDREGWGATATLNWSLGENLSLTSISN
jgi:outer membrane receptor protein involved in Fe transport